MAKSKVDYKKYLQEYFKPRINWKLIEFIKDITTKYADDGNIVCISVEFEKWLIYKYQVNYVTMCDMDSWSISDDHREYTFDFYSHIYHIDRGSTGILSYVIQLERRDDNGLLRNIGSKIHRSVYKRILSKFTDIRLVSETDIYHGYFYLHQDIIT